MRQSGMGYNPAAYPVIQLGDGTTVSMGVPNPAGVTGGNFRGSGEFIVPNDWWITQINASSTDFILGAVRLVNGAITLPAGTTLAGPIATLAIGGGNQLVRNPVNDSGSLSIEAAGGLLVAGSRSGTYFGGNAYNDGANWLRYNVSAAASLWGITSAGITYYTAPAGANPIALTTKLTIDLSGNLTVAGYVSFGANEFIQDAGCGIIRYVCGPPSGRHNFEYSGGGYATLWGAAFSVQSTIKAKRDLAPLNQKSALAQVLDRRVTPISFRYLTQDPTHLGFTC